MEIGTILLICVAVAIIVKTGSFGKALGFLFKWGVYPIIFALLGGLAGILLPGVTIGIGVTLGFITGAVKAILDAKKKLGG